MKTKLYYQYYVEGENEEKFINTLKLATDYKVIPGRVSVFNPKDQKFSDMMIIPLKTNTIVILVFDTDTDCTSILRENISFLKAHSNIKDVWCIPQCKNLEDEIVRSTDLSNILELYNSQGINAHKKRFNKDKDLMNKLREHHFDLSKLWICEPDTRYEGIQNDAEKIKSC